MFDVLLRADAAGRKGDGDGGHFVRRVAASESSFHAPLVEDLDAAAHSASAFGAHAGKIEYEAVFGHVRDALVHDFGETDDLIPSGSQGLFRTAEALRKTGCIEKNCRDTPI